MKRILQLSNYYYPHFGGIEQVAQDIAKALKDEDLEMRILCFNEDAEGGGFSCIRKETVSDEIEGISITRAGVTAKVLSQSLSPSYPVLLKKEINEFRPDVVIYHYPNPFAGSFLLKHLNKGFKLLVYWHSDIVKQKQISRVFLKQDLRLLNSAVKIIATSPNYIEGSPYLSQFKDKCVVIPNCVSDNKLEITEEIERKADEIRNRFKEKIICFGIGRHIPYKGFSYLIQASRYLDNRFAVVIGGSGELTDSLRQEASGDEKVLFTGRLSDEELTAYYLACDIFCFPSVTKNEAFGIALAEGMYFNKPAVTFSIPGSGVSYVNKDGLTGIECPNADSKAYADALLKLASDRELREKYGNAAGERVRSLFMFNSFKEEQIKLYKEITDRMN